MIILKNTAHQKFFIKFMPVAQIQAEGSSESSRTFVFERTDTHQSTILTASVDLSGATVDLSGVIKSQTGSGEFRLQIYDPASNCFLGVGSERRVERGMLEPEFVLVRLTPRLASRKGSSREDRSKERTIGQAIELVRQWRGLHHTRASPLNTRKRMTLPQAALLLGVPKKTLDDYYCQLRIAEHYGFDFEHHLEEGVGALRAFVRSKRNQTRSHPKFLRLIEDLSFLGVPESPREASTAQEELQLEVKCVRGCSSVEQGKEMAIAELENEFYRGFEYLLDEPNDPFNNLRFTGEESSNFLFF